MGMRATTIRFSEDLWQLLDREAQRQGVSAAQFLRESALLRLGAASARGDEAPAGRADRSADVSRQLADGSRLAALRATGMLDSPPAPAFDRLTRLASRFLNAPVALVSLIDADRQYFKSCLGLPEPWASRRETPLSHSFCQYVVARREPLIVSDAREHPELRESLAIRDLDVVAYAGVPLIDRAGHVLGSLCAIDAQPRLWSSQQVDTLRDLAETAVAAIELESERSQRSAAVRGDAH
ncbi:MAG: GAF domain-containing protein [Actinomycetota bacterium]|nr:GAF domain-containing protein [Actinomycetota bacterium]